MAEGNENDNDPNKLGLYKETINNENVVITSHFKTNEVESDKKTHEEQSSNTTNKQPQEFGSSKRDLRKQAEEPNYDEVSHDDSRKIEIDSREFKHDYNDVVTGAPVATKVDDNDETDYRHRIYKPSTSEETAKKGYSKERVESHRKFWDTKYITSLQAGIIEAEIKGNLNLARELKDKLEAARLYKKKIAEAGEENKNYGLTFAASSSTRNPQTHNFKLSTQNRSEKRKAESYVPSSTDKHFANEDKYNANQMVEENRSANIVEEAQLGHAMSDSTNPDYNLDDASLGDVSSMSDASRDDEGDMQEGNMDEGLKKIIEACNLCLDNEHVAKHLIVSCGTKVYMALPAQRSLVEGQCYISTIRHTTCVTSLDEDVWEEILYYRKMITQFFASKNFDVVFYETATSLFRFSHTVIHCIPLPKRIGHLASIYFKKALFECESNWSIHEKVIYLRRRNIRLGVPKKLPYFWVDFGMVPGFAHIIEDQRHFSSNFGEEVIGNMLRLDHSRWNKPPIDSDDEQKKKVLKFTDDWKPFEKSFQEKPHNI